MGEQHRSRKMGKHIQIKPEHPEFGIEYGTVNAENLRSIYIDMISNMSSSEYMTNEEFLQLHSHWKYHIRRIIYSFPNEYFYDNSIIGFNDYGGNIPANKQVFLIPEIILYTKYQFDIKDPEVIELITKISNKIIELFFSTENLSFTRKRIVKPNGKLETHNL